MHPEAHRGIRDMIVDSRVDLLKHEDYSTGPMALDIGGADVNGSARPLFAPNTTWIGMDIASGPGVDVVADATTWRGELPEYRSAKRGARFNLPAFDLVLCTEVFEHVEKWPLVLDTIHEALMPGGHAFLSFASEGRRPHGARGEHDVPEGEWYRNVSRSEFRQALLRTADQWSDFGCVYNANPGDIYAWLRR